MGPADFKPVFQQSRRSVDPLFTVLWRENDSPQARLGLALAKKNLRRATDRNLVKRILRESFRHFQQALAGLDLVVLARSGIRCDDRKEIAAAIGRHWDRVLRARAAAASANKGGTARETVNPPAASPN